MARAMWKGELELGEDVLPLKLYAAAQDHRVRFRLLHADDGVPVRQRSVHPGTGEVVPREEVRRGFEVEKGVLVELDDDDLSAAVPEPSRTIELLGFLAPRAIPEPYHERPYYLGPDGDAALYQAFSRALRESGRLALVRWVMRNKRYVGAIAAGEGSLGLTTLRRRGEVALLAGFHAPAGRELAAGERRLAEQLVSALEGHFDPTGWEEGYRKRVEGLVAAKAAGRAPKPRKARPKKPARSLSQALRASLTAARERRVA